MTLSISASPPPLPGTLLRKRDIWVPHAMSAYVPVDDDTFEATVREGHSAGFIAPGGVRPLPVESLADLSALHALYLGAVGGGPAVAAVLALQADGCTFRAGQDEVGLYGAWLGLQDRLAHVDVCFHETPIATLRADGLPTLPARAAEGRALVEQLESLGFPPQDGFELFATVRPMNADDRVRFLDLHRATGDLGWTQDAWQTIHTTGLDVAASTELMCQSLKSERSVKQAQEELTAVKRYLRPGETVVQATEALERIRQALPPQRVIETAMTFVGMRTTVSPSDEPLFLELVKRYEDGMHAAWMWGLLKDAGPAEAMERRVRLVIAQPKELWTDLVDRVKALPRHLPRAVDKRRAQAALLPVATLPDAHAVARVTGALQATSIEARTAQLERLALIMTAAGAVPAFDEARTAIARPGAPGTPEMREQLLADLVRVDSPPGIAPALALLQHVDRTPQFAVAAAQAVALAAAMPGHVDDAATAFGRILDARAAGEFAGETFDATLARFASAYASTRTVEGALARLRTPAGAGTVSRDGDAVVVGGIRVPRH